MGKLDDIDAKIETLAMEWLGGKTLQALAESNGCSFSAMRVHIRRHFGPEQYRKLAVQTKSKAQSRRRLFLGLMSRADELVARWKGGEFKQSLAKSCGVALPTINRVLRAALPEAAWRAIEDAHYAERQRKFKAKGISQIQEIQKIGAKLKARKVGTIRVTKAQRKMVAGEIRCKDQRRRWIKVSDHPGLGKDNWIPYAHYVWQHSHGRPVPEGYVVIHLDGDTMNDAPENLSAVTPEDKMRHIESRIISKPELKARQQRGLKRVMGKVNRDMGRVRRIRKLIPVPSCVTQEQQTAWRDNRGTEDSSLAQDARYTASWDEYEDDLEIEAELAMADLD